MYNNLVLVFMTTVFATAGFAASWTQTDSADFAAGTADSVEIRTGDVVLARYPVKRVADFKVNDDMTSNDQSQPSLAWDWSGKVAVVWTDSRNTDPDIYRQTVSGSGNPVGTNQRVNDDIGTALQQDPDIAIDGQGRQAIVWSDYRDGQFHIYAQAYDGEGVGRGGNFRVNDSLAGVSCSSPAVAINDSGEFAVVWCDDRDGQPDIYLQFFDSTGGAQGPNVLVNDDAGTQVQSAPDVYSQANGYATVVWEGYRSATDLDIYAQVFYQGTAVGANRKINDDATATEQAAPSVAGQRGGILVAWHDRRNGSYQIYAQFLDTLGTPAGGNIRVDNDGSTQPKEYPAVAMDASGGALAVWQDKRNQATGGYQIWGQYFSGGKKAGTNIRLDDNNEGPGKWGTMYPAVALEPGGASWSAWVDKREAGQRDIFATKFSSRLYGPGGTFVSSVHNTGYQVAEYGVITWDDSTVNGVTDIYLQIRTAPDPVSISDSAFRGPDGSGSSYYTVSGDSIFTGHWGDSCIQYKAYLTSSDTMQTPILQGVTIDWGGIIPVVLSSFTAMEMGGKIVLEWTTESEKDNLGFYLYKGMEKEGPYTKLNSALIPGQGTTGIPQVYTYQDNTGTGECWYYLEMVDLWGGREYSDIIRFTGSSAINKKGLTVLPRPCIQAGPNPLIDQACFTIYTPQPSAAEITIYNIHGGIVQKQRTCQPAGTSTMGFFLEQPRADHAEPGVYYYCIKINGFEYNGKLIKIFE